MNILVLNIPDVLTEKIISIIIFSKLLNGE